MMKDSNNKSDSEIKKSSDSHERPENDVNENSVKQNQDEDNNPILKITDLKKSFGKLNVLNNVNLEFKERRNSSHTGKIRNR